MQEKIAGKWKKVLYAPMPNVRSKDQRGVLVMLDEKFRDEIDAAFPRLGFTDRSTFIRDAVYKRLQEMNIHLPASLKAAPSRAGKGGRPRKKVEITQHGSHSVAIGGDFKSASGAHAQKPAKGRKGKRGKKKSPEK